MENPLANAPSSVEWIQTLELGYDQPKVQPTVCFRCGALPVPPTTTTDSDGNHDDKKETTTNTTTTTTTRTSTSSSSDSSKSPPQKLSKCAKCHVAAYCSRDCQIHDWKQGGHKLACKSYARLSNLDKIEQEILHLGNNNNNDNDDDDDGDNDNDKNNNSSNVSSGDDDDINNNNNNINSKKKNIHQLVEKIKNEIRTELFTRIRFYACPYAIYKTIQLGKGFLFLQSTITLKELSITIPKDNTGRQYQYGHRSILMHFLTMGEYDSELCRDDFELAIVRTKLQSLVDSYDSTTHVIILWRFRCGHIALGKVVLVPDYTICKQLGNQYYSEQSTAGAVQLNLDDL